MKWTEEQQKVIDLRNRNILVSAAAGSGKTAVLVERIIQMITDDKEPIDIDRLLIVTFTKAAAREMRERISKAIEKKLMEKPSDENLQRQSVLVRTAHITTIDSFCLNIVKNYFNEIDLNPGFRIADENELALIKAEILGDVFEDYYEKGTEEFHEMIENYATTRSDANIEELILKLYNCSTSYPWPIDWLEDIKKGFNVDDMQSLERCQWIAHFEKYMQNIAYDLYCNIEGAYKMCLTDDGPSQYADNLLDDMGIYEMLMTKTTYEQFYQAYKTIEYTTLSRKRTVCDPVLKDRVKAIRDKCKATVKNIKEKYFFQTPQEMLEDLQYSKTSVITLIDMTIEFYKRFAKEKENLGIVDFSDIEHFALDILVDRDREKDTTVYTKVAETLSNYYEEIMIDEYQDSNYVQETILNSISKLKYDRPNVFMVGDVKQSIYKFRMAKPELFMSKYENYSSHDSDYQKIDLCMNFRSRDVVLDGVNAIFEKIMSKKLGGIEYDAKARLYNGANYLDGERVSKSNELILIDTDTEDIIDDYYIDLEEGTLGEVELLDLSKKEKEAKIIASRIRELVSGRNPMQVQDKDSEGNPILRDIQYKDIVILLRGLTGWSETLMDIFAKEGIPLNVETRTGYFSATEIRLTINMLKVINNPRQDIPLVAVLKSMIGGMSNEEIAIIRVESQARDFYDALREYGEHHSNDLTVKVKAFLYKLEYFRNLVPYTPIHELIQKVLADTGYYNYIYANADGDRRRMNLDMLVEKAIAYEKTSYKGLFNFIRFIEKMVKFDIDFGEATALGTNDNFVKVMTIHKSKGLEFPVVFVAGLGSKFNMQDTRDKIIIHPELGIAPDYINAKLRLKCPTLMKNVVASSIKEETIAEELRVLYVALTRAKEKLILTGTMKNVAKKLEEYSIVFASTTDTFSYERVSGANSYMDLVLASLLDNEGFTDILEDYGIVQDKLNTDTMKWNVDIKTYRDMISDELVDDIVKLITKEDMLAWEAKKVYSEGLLEAIEKEENFIYKYEHELDMKSKFSITELKRLEQVEQIEGIEDELLFPLIEDEDISFSDSMVDKLADKMLEKLELGDGELKPKGKIPKFIAPQEEEIRANERGNAYHKVMERLEVEKIESIEDVEKQVKDIYKAGYITKEQYECIDNKSIYTFVDTDLGKRVKKAKRTQDVYCEQQFVMGRKASQIFTDVEVSDENILFQGIIDMYFEENGELVLVDYKTDRVKKSDGEVVLKERYTVQLDYYRQALEQLTGKKVKEMYIYSFALGKEIRLS